MNKFIIVGEEYVGYRQGNAYIISNGECKFSVWERKEDTQKVCDYLNKQQATISALKEENEQLKKELKRCKDWINSDKNDYELTLAFIKNKGYSLKDVLEYEKELFDDE